MTFSNFNSSSWTIGKDWCKRRRNCPQWWCISTVRAVTKVPWTFTSTTFIFSFVTTASCHIQIVTPWFASISSLRYIVNACYLLKWCWEWLLTAITISMQFCLEIMEDYVPWAWKQPYNTTTTQFSENAGYGEEEDTWNSLLYMFCTPLLELDSEKWYALPVDIKKAITSVHRWKCNALLVVF